MADGAPVCPVSRGQIPFDQRGLHYPAIPAAVDLPSALQAISAMRQIILVLSGQTPPAFRNNMAPLNLTVRLPYGGGASSGAGGGGIGRGGGGGKNKQPLLGDFNEVDRVTKKVRITNPKDDQQWVEVNQIQSITWENSATGQTIVWHLKK